MKNSTAQWITVPVILAAIFVFDVPFWVLLILLCPLLLIALTYFQFNYSFRPDLKIEPIPLDKYESRMREIENSEWELDWLGFRRSDQFYLNMSSDVVTYVYKHDREPIYLCIYHFGVKKVCDLVSFFEDEITLTTCSNVEGGMTPRPANKLLQIFEGASYSQLLEAHRGSIEFLQECGARLVEMPTVSFRERFMTSIHETAEASRKLFLWPLNLIFRTITKYGARYARSIEEQYRNGMVQLFQ